MGDRSRNEGGERRAQAAEGGQAGMATEDGARGCKKINDIVEEVKDRGAGSHRKALQKWPAADGARIHTLNKIL